MPRIRYRSYRCTAAVEEVIYDANDIIRAYTNEGLTLTLRQLYYRFVSKNLLPNTLASYDRLGSIINRARLAGYIDWDAIEDRGRNLISNSHWEHPGEIIESAAASYRVDLWELQPTRVEVWVEKQALESVVGRAASTRDCAYLACKGYMSQSEMWRAARRFKRYTNNGQDVVLLHLGDHDPSGVDMTRDIDDRLNEVFGADVEVRRIALTMDQIEEHRPPPNPAKLSDCRASKYIAEYGSSSWELDALEPATLHTLICDTIDEYIDRPLWNRAVKSEERARSLLGKASKNWDRIRKMLGKK